MKIYNNSYLNILEQKIAKKELLSSFFCFIFCSAVMAAMYLWYPLECDFTFVSKTLMVAFITILMVQIDVSYRMFSAALSKVSPSTSIAEKSVLFILSNDDRLISAGLGSGITYLNIFAFAKYATEYQQFLQDCTKVQKFTTTKELVSYASEILGYSQNLVILIYAGILAAISLLWFIVLKLFHVVNSLFTKSLCNVTATNTVTIVLKDSNNVSLDVTKEQLLFYKGFVIIDNKENNPFKVYKESEVEKIIVSNDSSISTNLRFNLSKEEWEIAS